MKKFLSRVYSLLITLFILCGAVLIGLYVYGIRPYIVQTGSMSPAMPAGSVCFVNHRADFDDVQEGDIIAFRLGTSTIVTHRAVKIQEDGIVTKGDANKITDDALVTQENFAGKTVFQIAEIGKQIQHLRTTEGKIHFLIFVILLAIPGFLLDDDKHQKEKST